MVHGLNSTKGTKPWRMLMCKYTWGEHTCQHHPQRNWNFIVEYRFLFFWFSLNTKFGYRKNGFLRAVFFSLKQEEKKSTSIILLNIFVMVTRAVGGSENPGVPVVIRWAICPPGLDRVKWSAKIRHCTPGPPQGRHPWVMDWNGQQIFSPTLIDNTDAQHSIRRAVGRSKKSGGGGGVI